VKQGLKAAQQASDALPKPPEAPMIDYDRAYRQRKRGIHVLAWSTVAFFLVAIAACYLSAAAHGYGTGFGDGKEVSSRVVPLGGTGFWGDLALLAGTIVIDVVVILVWYYLMSRLDNVGADDPVAPDDRQLDLNDPASWYVVQVPGLTKSLTVVAVACLIGIVVGAAVLLPVVSIRYGFLI
jgi:hypothetical protein